MTAPAGIPAPEDFFGHLSWLDGRPLVEVIEPYRARILTDALYTFDGDGRPTYNHVLTGRAKKNWKSADLCLAALYRFIAWPSPQGNDVFLLANDEGQAADDLTLVKKLVAANPALAAEVEVRAKELVRTDGAGVLKILPAKDVAGSHGKTFLMVGFDEIHAYRSHDLFEALAPDPTRLDALTWITSYASIFNSPGVPLYDLFHAGKGGDDPRMYFSWYAGDYTTDPDLADATQEERANPSLPTWGNADYLDQQRRRLPSHKFRRLHLNLPGMPDGAFFDAGEIMRAIVTGRRKLPPEPGIQYRGFVDMSGGSSDDATLAIAHRSKSERAVLDLVTSQGRPAPFNPRMAVDKFVGVLRQYGVSRVIGDRYGGETFRQDFREQGIIYEPCGESKSELYEALEPPVNAGEVELLDVPKLQEQILTLVVRGTKIDHQPGDHDDWANAAAGALRLVTREDDAPQIRAV